MPDHPLPLVASEFEQNVRRIIPFHEVIHQQVIEIALAVHPQPRSWLDTGCGPGHLAAQARQLTPGTSFTLADPAADMLALARQRLPDLPADHFIQATSEVLPDGSFDVVSAILCHHYGDARSRRQSVRRCKELLAPGGVFLTVENVRADTPVGQILQRSRWGDWQRRQGRSEADVTAHLAREGTIFHPISVSELVHLLTDVGFRTVEVFWRSYAQAGVFARP